MSDDQFTQIITKISSLDKKVGKLDGRIGKLDKRADIQDKRADSQDKSFLKLFQHMTQRFDTIEAKLDTKADKNVVNLIYNQLDGFLKRTDTDETERAALTSQVNRHDKWMHQLAVKTGDTLAY